MIQITLRRPSRRLICITLFYIMIGAALLDVLKSGGKIMARKRRYDELAWELKIARKYSISHADYLLMEINAMKHTNSGLQFNDTVFDYEHNIAEKYNISQADYLLMETNAKKNINSGLQYADIFFGIILMNKTYTGWKSVVFLFGDFDPFTLEKHLIFIFYALLGIGIIKYQTIVKRLKKFASVVIKIVKRCLNCIDGTVAEMNYTEAASAIIIFLCLILFAGIGPLVFIAIQYDVMQKMTGILLFTLFAFAFFAAAVDMLIFIKELERRFLLHLNNELITQEES
ncbi:uncharacterized protein LOC126833701 [Adelges cooleyi]|uniref:uncharacterized protein LOC126833701 n=1 Tax=Adelges cooleyi TaxID=133065 RepID=UPI00217FF288|nr:uncharacterized protein LOC126833701 [Adelges cooleyi]